MRARPLYTGSSAERAKACAASQALPWAVDAVGSEDARRGTAIHAFLANMGKLGKAAALQLVASEFRDACDRLDLMGLPIDATQFTAELALAWDYGTNTARVIGVDIGRAYGELNENEIPLTLDVAGVAEHSVIVADYKTGHGEVTPAARNPQLQLGALALARAYGKRSATVLLIYVREDRPPFIDRADFDAWDLEGFSDDYRDVAVSVAAARGVVERGQTPTVHLGSHCRYCPVARCPGRVSLIEAVSAAPEEWRRTATSFLTPDGAREAYHRYNVVKDAIAAVGRAIFAYAADHPIDLGDGRVFGPVTSTRERVEGNKVHATMTTLYGRDAAEASCERSSSKTAIKEALRSVAVESGRSVAEVEREFYRELRSIGGVEESVSTTFREHRPKGGHGR